MLLLLLGKNNLLSSSVFSILVSTILLFPSHRRWISCYDSTSTQHKFPSFALDSLAIVFLVCSCFSFCYCSVLLLVIYQFCFSSILCKFMFFCKIIFLELGGGDSYHFEMGLSCLNCEVMFFRILPKRYYTFAICHFKNKLWILSLSWLVRIDFR